MGTHTDEMKGQGRVGQMSYTNVHKAHYSSQLSIFHIGSCARARLTLNDLTEWVYMDALTQPARTSLHRCPHPNEFRRMPLPNLPEQVYRAPSNDPPEWLAWMSLHGCPQTTRTNEFTWAPTWSKWRHKGVLWKRATRTCTKPTPGHNLVFWYGLMCPGTPSHWTTQPNEFTRMPSLNPPEWVYMDALARPSRMSLHKHPQMNCPNELTWMPSNNPHKKVYMGTHMSKTKGQGRTGQTSYMNIHRAHSGSQLSIFYKGSCEWAWPHTKQPDWMSLHRCPHPICPNEFT